MDRNLWDLMGGLSCNVALRKESVDRNILHMAHLMEHLVALRKESVDRNGRPIDVQLIK